MSQFFVVMIAPFSNLPPYTFTSGYTNFSDCPMNVRHMEALVSGVKSNLSWRGQLAHNLTL